MKNKKIAIIGAGFCGLACAYYLLKYNLDLQVVLFDPGEIGENASGISAGLLHTYPGAHAKLVRYGAEGKAATLDLLSVAEKTLGQTIAIKTKLLRLAISEEQTHDFYTCAANYDDVSWYEASECQKLVAGLAFRPGILIDSAFQVKTKAYLEGLWKACQAKGAVWEKVKVTTLRKIEQYDFIIIAAGASITSVKEVSHLPVRPVKGQILEMKWPKGLPPLKFPINSKAYILQSEDPAKFIVGATFERKFKDERPDMEYACSYLLPKMTEMIPDLFEAEVLACTSGVRASTPTHLPLVRRENANTWVITGMGSKGLLYHALYAKGLIEEVIREVQPSVFS
jgi:glycine/D-amino acid oxidase-like deaminating enzyme